MSIDRALLYARTARHLRPVQWFYWPLRRIQAAFPPATLEVRGAAVDHRVSSSLARVVAGWGPGDRTSRVNRAEAIVADTFCFLGHAETLPEIDWKRRYVSHLWSYNLHYFEYAIDLAWAYRTTGDDRFPRRLEQLVDGWLAAHPTCRGDGWDPYPVSLRIVNWSYALLLCDSALPPAFRTRLIESLYRHSSFLGRRLELHLLANHYQKNLKALTIAGLLLTGVGPRRWQSVGVRGLWSELFEQVLPDGVHFERSPMYHNVVLGDYLEVASLLQAVGVKIPEPVSERIRSMVTAAGILCRPDGVLHLFNDSAQGIAPSRAHLGRLAESLLGSGIPDSVGTLDLPDAGYFGWISPSGGERLIIDCGEPGPSYQPGHAHCDLLSYELDLGGRPVVVDSGTSGYGGDPLREYVRSTRAHNTVMVGQREQSEVWGTFRLARRATVVSAVQQDGAGGYRFAGCYRPYHDRRCEHRRTIERQAGAWVVTDRIVGAQGAPLSSFVHLHPEFSLQQEGHCYVARTAAHTILIEPFGVDHVLIHRGERTPAQGWYCPEFGRALPSAVLELQVDANLGSPFGYSIRTADGEIPAPPTATGVHSATSGSTASREDLLASHPENRPSAK
jgi:uncharacterized heparinase superfamily protein